MKKLAFFFAFVLFYSLNSFSQEEVIQTTAKKNLENNKIFDRAEGLLLIQNYDSAMAIYLKLMEVNPNNANWNFKLGICYLNSPTQYSKSIGSFEKAIKNCSSNSNDDAFKEEKAPLSSYLYLADSYHRNYRFDEAIATYTKYKEFISERDKEKRNLIDHKIQVCKYGKDILANPVNMVIKNLGDSINSPYADYSPILSADESMILFTSRRPENVGGDLDEDGKYYEDIYISYKTEDGKNWQKAKNIGPPINTPEHEATVSASIDGQIIFIYKDDASNGSIYFTSMQGNNWTPPEKLGGDINSEFWESHAALSADGDILYFVSDRPGGYGGRDIYRCKKLPNGAWSNAFNMGPVINTEYNEDSPFIQPGSNKLYFSSEGHKNIGGFDIFTSNFVDTGVFGGWTDPENMGYPINTTGDDIFFVPTIDNKRAYYSSFAQGGLGDKDIYLLTFPEKEDAKLTVIRGLILDDFGNPASNTIITVTNANTGDIVGNYSPNPKTGKYIFILPYGKSYQITYEGDGFHTFTSNYKLEAGQGYLESETAIMLQDVHMSKQILGTVGVSGVVKDIQEKAISGCSINVIDNISGKSVGKFTSDNKGFFSFVVDRGKNYSLTFEAANFLFQSENISLPSEKVYSRIEKNIVLQPVKDGSKIVLKNLFFDVNKSKVRNESLSELKNVYDLLTESPTMKVEISGHSDNKGNDKANLLLSKERATAVMNYLIKMGINKTRLVAVGYGKNQPLTTNDTDQSRQSNRRVELKIINK